MPAKRAKPPAAKIVAATGFSSGGMPDGLWTSRELDEVMSDAVMEAMEDGVPLDSPKMKERMMQAVEEFKSVRKTAAAGKK
jgi:hypothetical protein